MERDICNYCGGKGFGYISSFSTLTAPCPMCSSKNRRVAMVFKRKPKFIRAVRLPKAGSLTYSELVEFLNDVGAKYRIVDECGFEGLILLDGYSPWGVSPGRWIYVELGKSTVGECSDDLIHSEYEEA